jgi:hypothetical protein
LNCPARLLTGEGEFSLTTTFWACSYQVMEGARSRTCSRNTHQNIRHPSVSRCSRLHKDRAQGSSRVRIGNAGPAVLRSSTGEFFNACQPNLEVRGDPAFFPGLPTALIEPDSSPGQRRRRGAAPRSGGNRCRRRRLRLCRGRRGMGLVQERVLASLLDPFSHLEI